MKQDRKNAETLFESLSLNLPAMAQVIKKKGRGRDTVLAHITPDEAKLLKKRGGRGSINPDTGLLEFEDFYSGEYMGAPDFTPQAGVSDSYTGGGYDPIAQTGGGVDWSSGSAVSLPETSYAPTQDYAGYTGVQVPGYQTDIATPLDQMSTNITAPQGTAGYGVRLPGTLPGGPGFDVQQRAETIDTTTPRTDTQEGVLDKLARTLGTDKETLSKLGIGSLQTLGAALATSRAAKQGRETKKELQGIAAPYRAQGKELIDKAQRGELTPVAQQSLEAARARLAQGVETRGGVGAAQITTQVEAFRQQLIQQQYDTGLKIAGIGDQIEQGAIKAGLEADRYVNELASNYFTNIGRTIFGVGGAPASKTITISS